MKKHLSLLIIIIMLCPLCACTPGNNTPVQSTPPESTASVQPTVPAATPVADVLTEPADADGKVSLAFKTENSRKGKVTGEKNQHLYAGTEPMRQVTAVPKTGFRFERWSDGCTSAVREGETFTGGGTVYAIFAYDELELPILELNTEKNARITTKTDYVDCTVSLQNTGDRPKITNVPAQVRLRGNNTMYYDKKSYKLKLGIKKNLLGIAESAAKTWVLLANMCDQSLLRNRTCLEMGQVLDNLPFEPHCYPIEVYINGEYLGCYLLAEEINVHSRRVEVCDDAEAGTDTGYLVQLSAYANDDTVFTIDNKRYQIINDLSADRKLAAQQKQFIEDYMTKAFCAVRSGNEAHVRELIDIDSFVDAYLLEEISKNIDMGWDSFYFCKDKGGKLTVGPCWDFDLSLGNAAGICEDTAGLYTALYTTDWFMGDTMANPWFYYIMENEWFRTLVRNRWNEMHKDLAAFPALITEWGKQGYNSYCRNFEKWDIFGKVMNREPSSVSQLKSYKAHYRHLSSWLSKRLKWLDAYFNTDEFLSGGFITDISYRHEDAAARNIRSKYTDITYLVCDMSGTARPYSNSDADKLFDGNRSTKYCCFANGSVTVSFTLNTPVALSAVTVTTGDDTQVYPKRNPVRWRLYGSNDGNSWTKLDIRQDSLGLPADNYCTVGFYIADAAAYANYKWEMDFSGDILQLSNVNLFA